MAAAAKVYDVFISHAPRDSALASEVADACRAGGLEALTDADAVAMTEEEAGDALWEALAECRALLAILGPTGPTPSMAVEIGAARAWNKPIFAIATDPATTRLPHALAGITLYTTGRVPDVIRRVASAAQQLDDEDRDYLAKVYAEAKIPVDQLAVNHRRREEMVRRFNEGRGKNLPGERLLSELLRLRKQGKLTRTHSTGAAKSGRDTG